MSTTEAVPFTVRVDIARDVYDSLTAEDREAIKAAASRAVLEAIMDRT